MSALSLIVTWSRSKLIESWLAWSSLSYDLCERCVDIGATDMLISFTSGSGSMFGVRSISTTLSKRPSGT